MKKITFIIIAAFISSCMFAQLGKLDPSKLHKSTNNDINDDSKSAWVGGGYEVFYSGATMGDHFFIAGSEFSKSVVGDKITKVRFYHHLGTVNFTGGASATFTNTTYTVKIYENPILGGDYAAMRFFDVNIGTPVYTQSVTLGETESGNNYELTLETPYEITDKAYWVAISFDDGKGAMKLGRMPNNSYLGKYYMYATISALGGTFIVDTDFGNESGSAYLPVGISLLIDDGNPEIIETSDIVAKFMDIHPNPTSYISSISVSATNDLKIYPVIENNGPDVANKMVTVSIEVNDYSIYSGTKDLASNPLHLGFYDIFEADPNGENFTPITLTAAKMDELGLSGNFDIIYTAIYAGDDDVESNNTTTLTVTREALVEEPVATITPDLIFNAGQVAIAKDSTKTFTIKNTGTGTLTISSVGTLTGAWSTNLTADAIADISLEANEETTFTITFAPTAKIEYESSLEIVTNGGDPQIITLSGEGTDGIGINGVDANEISIFPNPSKGDINIKVSENSVVNVVDLTGKIIETHNVNANSTLNVTKPSGMYFIQVESNGKVRTQKLVVE